MRRRCCRTFALARRLLSDAEAALAALVLLGTHYTFTHFATTGFGVTLQALAALCALLGLCRFGENPSARNGAILGAGLSFLALCRLDSAVLGIPVVLCALFFARRGGRAALPGVALSLGIPATVGGFVAGLETALLRRHFPCNLLHQGGGGAGGAGFVGLQAAAGNRLSDDILAAVFFVAAGRRRRFRRLENVGAKNGGMTSSGRGAVLWTMAAMCVLWHGYMFSVGGGYAEFRFMAATAPPLMILLAWGFSGLTRHWRAAAVAAAAVFSHAAFAGGGPRSELRRDFKGGTVMLRARLTSEIADGSLRAQGV